MSRERILITGGADGLGREMALGYAARDCEVLVLDVDQEKGTELAQHEAIRFREFDLARFEELTVTWDDEPPFDRIIMNAGISAFGNFAEIAWEKQQAVIDINFTGHLRLLHQLLGMDKLQEKGRLAFVLSAAAFTPIPVTATYAASKAALEAFGHSIEPWLMHRGISVTLVYPGQMRTAHLRKYYGNENADAGIPPDVIADRILKGMDRRSRHLYPDAMSKVFRFLATTIPWAMPTLIYRFNRKRFAEMLYPDLVE
tara:strand:- start:11704 stop:12474 length:771 start_codon:yes stop_codon:yes gene_type:complete